jgi:hypothetical protein
MGYASLAYLKKGAQLWVTRVTPSDAKKAMATIPVPSGYDTYQGLWESASTAIGGDKLTTKLFWDKF